MSVRINFCVSQLKPVSFLCLMLQERSFGTIVPVYDNVIMSFDFFHLVLHYVVKYYNKFF